MTNITAIIIDDEKHARESLIGLLDLYYPSVRPIGNYSNIKEGENMIKKLNPDIVFLDIAIGKDTGFDLLEKLSPFNFQLIFVTGYSEFALKAFQVNAVDYLLKPIEPDSLVNAIEKAKKLMDSEILENNFANLFHSLKNKVFKRISIPSRNDGISILNIAKIIYVQGSGPYSTFFTEEGQKVMASNNLGHYQSLLPENDFYRTHQSYLVNIKCIRRIITNDGMIELANGEQIPIARSRRDGLMEKLL